MCLTNFWLAIYSASNCSLLGSFDVLLLMTPSLELNYALKMPLNGPNFPESGNSLQAVVS